MTGTLTLIATPIDDESFLDIGAKNILLNACENLNQNIILIEDIKPCRRRWLHFGLAREVIDSFVEFNEHTQKLIADKIIENLNKGINYYLMSDGGLPAFCDPGQELVRLCHENGIKVTCSPHSNSISLAIALSGIDCSKFFFSGFLPKDSDERKIKLREYFEMEFPVVIMDTPYRLKRTLEEMVEVGDKKKIFLGVDLNAKTQELYLARPSKILRKMTDFKREFIAIVS